MTMLPTPEFDARMQAVPSLGPDREPTREDEPSGRDDHRTDPSTRPPADNPENPAAKVKAAPQTEHQPPTGVEVNSDMDAEGRRMLANMLSRSTPPVREIGGRIEPMRQPDRVHRVNESGQEYRKRMATLEFDERARRLPQVTAMQTPETPTPAKGLNGKCRLAGKIISTTLKSNPSKKCVRCILSTEVATEETGPQPDKWPDGEVWRDKVEISGTWYIDRVG